jgi:membrane associated rhomboid family serine protease
VVGRLAGGGLGGVSATGWLIGVNVVVFLLGVSGPLGSRMQKWGHFSTARAFFEQASVVDGAGQVVGRVLVPHLEVWRFVTFQFLHAGVMHLAMNMLGLWVFGRAVEERVGARRYLAFYLVCGIFGALLFVILNLLGHVLPGVPGLLFNDPSSPLVGASAGVFGVIMACAYLMPREEIVLLFPPIPMKMKTFAYAYVGLSLFMLVIGSRNAGGEAAHLGGAIAGYFFIRNTHLLRDFFDVFQRSDRPKGRAVKRGKNGPMRAGKSEGSMEASEVDAILDKIREQGASSLTAKERERLARASASDGGAG